MLPTIDISVLGVLGAIGGFFAWLWSVICRVFEWCQNKFVLFWLGSRVGRSVAEFTLFAFCYSVFVLGMGRLIQWAISHTISISVPAECKDAWRYLNLCLPCDSIVDFVVDVFSLANGYFAVLVIWSHYRRVSGWLLRVIGAGRV